MAQITQFVVTQPAVGAGKIMQAVFQRQLVPERVKLAQDVAAVQVAAVDVLQLQLFLTYRLMAVPGHKLPAQL
jgi:hypothetical protein